MVGLDEGRSEPHILSEANTRRRERFRFHIGRRAGFSYSLVRRESGKPSSEEHRQQWPHQRPAQASLRRHTALATHGVNLRRHAHHRRVSAS